MGKDKYNHSFLSPHQQLADSIGASLSADSTLGGTFHRGSNGEIYTTEMSGHFGMNWTDAYRQQFKDVMSYYGMEVHHEKWH